MRSHRGSRTLTGTLTLWTALLAVLMAALVPSISHALAGKAGAAWIEVCTTGGAKWIKAASTPASDAQAAGTSDEAPAGTVSAFEHCAYCSLHANDIALPAAPAAVLPQAPAGTTLPLAFLAAPRTLHAWLSAQPRAPPAAS